MAEFSATVCHTLFLACEQSNETTNKNLAQLCRYLAGSGVEAHDSLSHLFDQCALVHAAFALARTRVLALRPVADDLDGMTP